MSVHYPVVALLMLAYAYPLWSQRSERAIVATAGTTVAVGSEHITWTVGDIVTAHHHVPDHQHITDGFQQPYYSVAYLRGEDFSGTPGELRRTRIFLDRPQMLFGTNITAITMRLRFNATLLAPLPFDSGVIPHADTIIDGMRELTLTVPVPVSATWPVELASIGFNVGLGNDTMSHIEILDARAAEAGVLLRSAPGSFTLLGICRQGGTRLVDPIARTNMLLRPNPATSIANVEFDIEMAGAVRVWIVDMMGRVEQTVADADLAPGHYRLAFDATALPAGAHAVVLQTSGTRTSRTIIVQR